MYANLFWAPSPLLLLSSQLCICAEELINLHLSQCRGAPDRALAEPLSWCRCLIDQIREVTRDFFLTWKLKYAWLNNFSIASRTINVYLLITGAVTVIITVGFSQKVEKRKRFNKKTNQRKHNLLSHSNINLNVNNIHLC